jgi:ABC-type spermidine/putrescine transport system permease subunit II
MNSIPIATPPLFYSAVAGTTTSFQLWHRDIGGSAFSNGLLERPFDRLAIAEPDDGALALQ